MLPTAPEAPMIEMLVDTSKLCITNPENAVNVCVFVTGRTIGPGRVQGLRWSGGFQDLLALPERERHADRRSHSSARCGKDVRRKQMTPWHHLFNTISDSSYESRRPAPAL